MHRLQQRRHPGGQGGDGAAGVAELGGVEAGQEQLGADEDGAVGPVEAGEADVAVQVVELGQQLGGRVDLLVGEDGEGVDGVGRGRRRRRPR